MGLSRAPAANSRLRHSGWQATRLWQSRFARRQHVSDLANLKASRILKDLGPAPARSRAGSAAPPVAASIGEIVAHSSSRNRLASSTSSSAGPSWRSDRPRNMAGRWPGRLTANPPETSSTSVSRFAPEGCLGGDEVPGELAEQEAGLPQRRRDHHRKTALQHGPGRFQRGHCALAALSRRIEQQAWRYGEQHIALPKSSVTRQCVRPTEWDRRAWWTETILELRASCEARPTRA